MKPTLVVALLLAVATGAACGVEAAPAPVAAATSSTPTHRKESMSKPPDTETCTAAQIHARHADTGLSHSALMTSAHLGELPTFEPALDNALGHTYLHGP